MWDGIFLSIRRGCVREIFRVSSSPVTDLDTQCPSMIAAKRPPPSARNFALFSDADISGGISIPRSHFERSPFIVSELRHNVAFLLRCGLLVEQGHMLKVSPSMHLRVLTDDEREGGKRPRDKDDDEEDGDDNTSIVLTAATPERACRLTNAAALTRNPRHTSMGFWGILPRNSAGSTMRSGGDMAHECVCSAQRWSTPQK